ncbi:MAG TPA: alpha/beta hydrolase [Solirubrobacteraceae bacterium]|nr:alpha/beta hydrolase [Solirubrobacteraceae bacterium]
MLALALPASAFASSAVVLVSGFDSHTPFTTALAGCATQTGPTWNSSTGTAASLRAAGEQVFTAPVANAGTSPGSPCTAPGGAVPPASDVIDSNGDVDANGAALMGFLQFLAAHYGVTNVSLVGHSDGGLWSRSAITQMRADSTGPVVQSLTTLGTPHTGSFGADLAELVTDGKCELSNPTEQALCEAVLSVINKVFADLGPTAVRELSSSFLEGWNPQQTIGCPVSVAAGTYVKIPYIGWLLPRYYNPSDGIVGQASALAQASTSLEGTTIPSPGIPDVISIGSFPVVHTADLSFLGTTNTLTNDPAIGMAVLAAVQAGATRPACSAPGLATPGPRPHSRVVRVREPFRVFGLSARRSGHSRGRGRGQVAFLLPGGSIRCGSRPVRTVPLLGSRRVRLAVVRCAHRVRIRGRVLLVGRDPQRRELVVTRRGRTLRVHVAGPPLRRLRVRVHVRRSWRAVHHGKIRLPARTRTVSVRAVGVGRDRLSLVATAVVGR